MARQQAGKVRLQSRVDVDEQEIVGGEKVRRVSERAGRSQDLGLVEQPRLRGAGRKLADARANRLRQVMGVDADLRDARPAEAGEVRPQKRDVAEGEERLGDRFRDRPEPRSAAGREEHGFQGFLSGRPPSSGKVMSAGSDRSSRRRRS